MLTIGDFARLGGVTVRMLRHYDATGLLAPARVDPASGYRYYAVAQLARLDRLLALKDLGFSLDRVRAVLDDEVSADELRGMLRLRRAELAEQITADTARLARVEARLRSIESEDVMNTLTDNDYEVVPVDGHRLVTLSTTVDGQPAIGPAVGPLFGRLGSALVTGGGVPADPSVAVYTFDDSGAVRVTVGFGWDRDELPGPLAAADARIEQVPAVEQCARTTYRGSMAGIGEAWTRLMRWSDANGWVIAGPCREVYRHTPQDAPDDWVTELEQPVRRA